MPGNIYIWGAFNFRFCGDVWYYNSIPKLDTEGARLCTTHLQLTIKEYLSLQLINNETLKWLGFEITWQLDQNKSLSCGACLDIKGICGKDISKPSLAFLCYYPNTTSHPEKCPANAIYLRYSANNLCWLLWIRASNNQRRRYCGTTRSTSHESRPAHVVISVGVAKEACLWTFSIA